MLSVSDSNNCHLPCVLVICGVSGCGKSSVASALAHQLGCPFYEGDDFHPQSNLDKMRCGVPLTDEDRAPWLCALAAVIQDHVRRRSPAVVSCSALNRSYRDLLRQGAGDHTWLVGFVLLDPPMGVLEAHVQQRAAAGSHFMPPSLLRSQLATLERPHYLPGHEGPYSMVQGAQGRGQDDGEAKGESRGTDYGTRCERGEALGREGRGAQQGLEAAGFRGSRVQGQQGSEAAGVEAHAGAAEPAFLLHVTAADEGSWPTVEQMVAVVCRRLEELREHAAR
mmetsp:Transcript_38663/g.86005  ORF Transcript_38663/g.86005 Transcript_38663/m.86005 type:complete len:280 (+) Transcript_38663:169-1008(+)